MNNDDGIAKRRARLQALRGRYEHPSPSHGATPATLVTPTIPDPMTPVQSGRRGRGGRGGRQEPARPGPRGERQGGGLLQRFTQFLSETPPGDVLIPGTSIGEQRLQQAIRLLEQRSRTAQGGANERIQRLLKFLKQDIPGEPMAGGVNLWRLQQILERVSRLPETEASSAVLPALPPARAHKERVIEANREATQSPRESVHHADTEGAGEIAALEADLLRLQAVTQDLQARLDQARQRVKTPSGVKPAPNVESLVDRLPESNASPRVGGDDWFLEFLE